ncbi:hypothetical protein ACH4SP_03355 [Streptomyces sp. NPDC021093]|uniref:hypothetical protein n=1 Tax=Streptomyces sp. NPDC021093 TaxID=3365112 RepID=UPI0037A49C73
MHVFDTSHCARETKLPETAPLIADFLDASAHPTALAEAVAGHDAAVSASRCLTTWCREARRRC